jgi:hypothetical protein
MEVWMGVWEGVDDFDTSSPGARAPHPTRRGMAHTHTGAKQPHVDVLADAAANAAVEHIILDPPLATCVGGALGGGGQWRGGGDNQSDAQASTWRITDAGHHSQQHPKQHTRTLSQQQNKLRSSTEPFLQKLRSTAPPIPAHAHQTSTHTRSRGTAAAPVPKFTSQSAKLALHDPMVQEPEEQAPTPLDTWHVWPQMPQWFGLLLVEVSHPLA